MTALHLSRVRLKSLRGEALASIAPLLIPDDPKQRPGHAHRVLWLLFQDVPDTARDFLWRDEGDGRFMLLSARPPTDPHGLFDLQTKAFEPKLAAGDRLWFALRANPTVSSKPALGTEARATTTDAKRPRGKRIDVVMKALHAIPRTEWDKDTGRAASGRAVERDRLVTKATGEWLAAQLAKAGATLDPDPTALTVSNYVQVPLDRRSSRERRATGDTGRPGGFSTVDITGSLEVNDPATFLAKLTQGFGSAKAFGCGLMLIRRA